LAEVAQAREAYRLAQVRYSAGVTQTPSVSPQLELNNAEVSLITAETNHLNALYDYNVGRSQLDRAVGRYSYGMGAGFTSPPGPKVTGAGK
jgi:outer membrane protein TolC